jgi:hypothetical protein
MIDRLAHANHAGGVVAATPMRAGYCPNEDGCIWNNPKFAWFQCENFMVPESGIGMTASLGDAQK